jgi:hypothetical protein
VLACTKLIPDPEMLLFTVNAKVWFDVADGWELERVSERELTCVPCAYALNEPRTIFQPAAGLEDMLAAAPDCGEDAV